MVAWTVTPHCLAHGSLATGRPEPSTHAIHTNAEPAANASSGLYARLRDVKPNVRATTQ